jgi:protein disulfide-isomerase
MRAKILLLPVILVAAIFPVRADDEKIPLLKSGNDTYTNVIVTSHSATDIYFIHAGGMANVKISSLSPALQKQFGFDAKKAQAAETKLAEDKASYHQQLLHQSAAAPPDLTRAPAGSGSGDPTTTTWRSDYPGALKQARSDGKLVLLDFTGSDWCPWCIKFDREILVTTSFAAYAARNLELVRVDFLRHTALPEAVRQANDALARQFNVTGFPTFVLVDANGKELGRQVGFLNGGPDAFVVELRKFSGR